MKKLLVLLLSMGLLCLAACTVQNEAPADEQTPDTVEETPALEEETPALEEIGRASCRERV